MDPVKKRELILLKYSQLNYWNSQPCGNSSVLDDDQTKGQRTRHPYYDQWARQVPVTAKNPRKCRDKAVLKNEQIKPKRQDASVALPNPTQHKTHRNQEKVQSHLDLCAINKLRRELAREGRSEKSVNVRVKPKA